MERKAGGVTNDYNVFESLMEMSAKEVQDNRKTMFCKEAWEEVTVLHS